MKRSDIDPDTFMHSMMNECAKQEIPTILIYLVSEEGKPMLRVRANRSAPEIQAMWDSLHSVNAHMIEEAAKALAGLENVPWENYGEQEKAQVRTLAQTAIVAALRANAPKAPPTQPKPLIIS